MQSRVRRQHWINFLSGGWLSVSPWVLDYLEKPLAAALNALIAGSAILLASLLALQFEEEMQGAPKVTALLGAWTMLAPWVLKFTDRSELALNAIAAGLLVFIMSVWMLGEESTRGQRAASDRGRSKWPFQGLVHR